jgi:hypothetical protein
MTANEQIADASDGRLTPVHRSDSREMLRMPLISRLLFTV